MSKDPEKLLRYYCNKVNIYTSKCFVPVPPNSCPPPPMIQLQYCPPPCPPPYPPPCPPPYPPPCLPPNPPLNMK